MSRTDLERQLALRFAPVSRAWRQLADNVLAELHVSNSTGWCLVFLDRLGPDVRQADLARVIGISQPSLVRTLDRLEAAGLIERHCAPEDRRSNHLRVTEAGRVVREQIDERLNEERAHLLADVSDEDIHTTLHVLERLSANIARRRAAACKG